MTKMINCMDEKSYMGAMRFLFEDLLDRDVPKRPVETEDMYKCPKCGGMLAMKSKYLCIPCQNKFCGGCGQRLDWIGDNEDL